MKEDFIVYNLRHRWGDQLAHVQDWRLVVLYHDYVEKELYKGEKSFLEYVQDCVE